ncbi:MAG: RNHCP domain-containing protein [Candidatus Moraniibacteriota bacterium]|nr:MAG: RNHCP domain-containing protein [Candidatus Moranbacteria bacterium]
MESKKFKRNKEDFTCKHCGFFVRGNGYTNHCSKCLWGCHVDIYPGDRLESCEGMMEPVDIFQKKGENFVIHRCILCEYQSRNKLSEDDDMDCVIALMKKNIERLFRK